MSELILKYYENAGQEDGEMSKPKEHPILFSSEMVRVILDGRKTQMRWPFKPQPPDWVTEFGYSVFTPKRYISGRGNGAEKFIKLPWKVGDLLWVRETWRLLLGPQKGKIDNSLAIKKNIIYGADYQSLHMGHWDSQSDQFVSENTKWRPSIHMPRWASRLTLRITKVRVQRVQEISEIDCENELGVKPYSLGNNAYSEFQNSWNSIYAKRGYPWSSDPWVWVITFEVVK